MAKIVSVDELGRRLTEALGNRLITLIVYGSAAGAAARQDAAAVNTLLVCAQVDQALFEALAPVVTEWEAAGHPPPILLSEEEWRDSSDAFAIEYEDIRARHRVVAGRDPWSGIVVRREDVVRQLEHELLGKLVRLRQGYVATLGDGKRLALLVSASAAGVLTMWRTLLRVAGRAVPETPGGVVKAAGELVGFPVNALAEVVASLESRQPLRLAARDPGAMAYLTAVARTAAYVNRGVNPT
jgi:hypothetical protein